MSAVDFFGGVTAIMFSVGVNLTIGWKIGPELMSGALSSFIYAVVS